jgi:hypothetical protein
MADSATPPKSVMSLLPSLQEPGKRLVDAGELFQAFSFLFSTHSGIVGGAAAPGPMMNAAINEVVSGTDVSLPPAIAGRQITILNSGTGTLTVNAAAFNPATGDHDHIGTGGAMSATQPTGTSAVYICYALGLWTQVAPALAPSEPPP